MLNLHRLWILRQLDVHGGIVAAASALGYTPSALSQQIRALEREVGVTLVEKHGRGVRLSPAGRSLLPHVDVAVAAVTRAEADLAAERADVTGTVRVGAFPSFVRARLPRLVTDLHHRHRELVLEVHQDEPEQGLRALEAGTRDIVVAYDYDLVAPGSTRAERCDLLAEPILLVSSGSAARSGTTGAVDLASCADASWILPPPGTSCHDMVMRACGRAGFAPSGVGHVGDFAAVCALAAAGHGVGLVPAMGITPVTEGLVARPTEPPLTRRVYAAIRPGSRHHPRIAAVLDMLTQAT